MSIPWILLSVKTIIHGVTVPLTFVVLDLPTETQYPIIVGRSWLQDRNAAQDWTNNALTVGF